MQSKEIKEYFEGLKAIGSIEIKASAERMLEFLSKLDSTNYLENLDASASLHGLCIRIADRKGYVIVGHTASKLIIEGYRDAMSSDPAEDFVTWATIQDTENPIREIDEFIERITPELQVSWK